MLKVGTEAGNKAASRVRVIVIDPRKFQPNPSSDHGTSEVSSVSSISSENEGDLPKKKVILKSRVKKRKLSRESLIDDEGFEDNDELDFVQAKTETVTRTGRVSKPAGTNASSNSVKAPFAKQKKDPPEMFRCQSCLKVYLGYTKLKLHYRKFPEHRKNDAEVPASKPPLAVKNPISHPVSTQTPASFEDVKVEEEETLQHLEISTEGHRESPMDFAASPLITNGDSFLSPFNRQDNSPPEQPASRQLCIAEQIDPPSSQNISFSSYYRNPGGRNGSNSEEQLNINGRQNGGANNGLFHSFAVPILESQNGNSGNCNHHNGSRIEPRAVSTSPSPTPIREKEVKIYQERSIWEVVEEKMIHLGINQMLVELSDVAEKLSKIARDKIIPIREEEEERLNSSVPIVQVDNPFLSHLMDLPFGTYVFREDAGIRRVVPTPPVGPEISLTGGVEVDVDKFLCPDIDLINLPHLTNLDLSSICNE